MPERTAQLNQPVTKDDLKDLSNPGIYDINVWVIQLI
jgi:hypothetical protein